jgi:hypothetical protein
VKKRWAISSDPPADSTTTYRPSHTCMM